MTVTSAWDKYSSSWLLHRDLDLIDLVTVDNNPMPVSSTWEYLELVSVDASMARVQWAYPTKPKSQQMLNLNSKNLDLKGSSQVCSLPCTDG